MSKPTCKKCGGKLTGTKGCVRCGKRDEGVRPREAGNCPFCGVAPGTEHNSMCGLKDVPWASEAA